MEFILMAIGMYKRFFITPGTPTSITVPTSGNLKVGNSFNNMGNI
jgi:hypothetical protein